MQDVISRMESEDVREGETVEDLEARGLLNKFLGSQVILSGIESNAKLTTTSSASSQSTTKITTTVMEEGGKPTTVVRIFKHPISESELDSLWNQETLRLLLDQCTDYEERKRIRARLRHVMAEQEAASELVEKASQEQIGGTFEGESQLLPLLQGLLEAPDTEQTADSGTESGEDQRSGLIAEVQNALDKLSASLRSDATDITEDRRSSLLQLVTKLQAGLATSGPSMERRSSGQGRFNRRRQRPNRHTVGVSSEELADARRLIEEISLHELTPSQSQAKMSLLQKQNSEGCVGHNSKPAFKPFTTPKSVVKNAVAKPFSSSNSTVSGSSSAVQTPTEPSESLDLLFGEEPKEVAPPPPPPLFPQRSISLEERGLRRPLSSTISLDLSKDVNLKTVQQAVQQAAAVKLSATPETKDTPQESETDEDSTVKAQNLQSQDEDDETFAQPPSNLIMQTNPLYYQQKETLEERANKFNTKKLKMKRANTIDIPKPLNFYEDADDSDCSMTDEDFNKRRRSNYLALRGPIRVGNGGNKNPVPVFEPKTENDKKFLAFISKHNENSNNKSSLWAKPAEKGNIWSNKFGHIKTTFEKASSGTPTAQSSQNTARNFWKTADDAVHVNSVYSNGPKISKQGARNLQLMFEEKQKKSQKLPWSVPQQNDKNIVTGSLQVKAFDSEKSRKFGPQPLPVNKFSHAPQSAFKPLPKKAPATLSVTKAVVKPESREKEEPPLYLYSPKPQNDSPSKPWVTSPGESRVLSLAASKFETVAQQESAPLKPRKMSKDKIVLPNFQQPQRPVEKLTAPYLVKSAEDRNSNVRKMSGQYDAKNSDAYSTYTTVKYAPTPDYGQQYRQQYQQYPQPPQQYAPTGQQYMQPAQQYNTQPAQQYSSSAQQYTPPAHQYTPPTQQFPQYGGNQQYYAQGQQYDYGAQYQPQPQYGAHQPQQFVGHGQYLPQNQQYSGQSQYGGQNQGYSSLNENSQNQKYLARSQYLPQNQQCVAPNQQYRQSQYDYQELPRSNQRPYDETTFTSNYSYQPQIRNNYSQISQPAKDLQMSQPQIQPTVYYNQVAHNNKVQPEPLSDNNAQVSLPVVKPVQSVVDEISEPTIEVTGPPKLESQVSVESVHEYNAVNIKVMTGPVSQQATTVRQKSPMSRNEHDMAAAFSLKNALQKVGKSDQNRNAARNENISPKETVSPKSYHDDVQKVTSPTQRMSKTMEEAQKINSISNNVSCRGPEKVLSPPNVGLKNSAGNVSYKVSPQSFSYKSPEKAVSPHSFTYKNPEKVVSPQSFSYKNPEKGVSSNTFAYRSAAPERRSGQIQSLEYNDVGESVVSSKFQIPVINVPKSELPRLPSHNQIMNKADSWNQVCNQKQLPSHKPSPRSSPNARTVLKSKSSHTLALPKLFEAGMSKDEMVSKKKTMEAFLGGDRSPIPLSRTSSNDMVNRGEAKVVKRSINRVRTSEKASTYRHSSLGLSRSRTLPDIACPDLLDESNVEQAFDDLFKSSS